MKKIFFVLGLVISSLCTFSQSRIPIRGDSIVMERIGGNAELILLNGTRNNLHGLLTNIGLGRTQFIKPQVINDSTIIIGLDTFILRGGIGHSGNVGTVTSVAAAGLVPLFTTVVNTATSTPSVVFTLSSAPANSVFGRNGASAGAPNYFTPLLASSVFSNQGTATTVLHGNAAGDPSWGAVNLATDVTGLLPNANLANSTLGFTVPGITGTAPNWAASSVALGNNVVLNIPYAGSAGVTMGLVSKTDYDAWYAGAAGFPNIPSNTVIGRILPGTGAASPLTGTEVTTLLSVFTSTDNGVAPQSGGGTVNFLRADGIWAPLPGGGGATWGSITGTLSAQTDLQAALDLKANLASPTFTGIPAAPTAAPGTNTTQIASTAFVTAAVAGGSSLTSTQIGHGSVANLLTGEADFTWDATNDRMSIGAASSSYNLGINAAQPKIGLSQSGTVKSIIGVSDATNAIRTGSLANELVIKTISNNKILTATDSGYMKTSFVDASDANMAPWAHGAALFEINVSTAALGHTSEAFVLRNTATDNSSRLSWATPAGKYAGAVGYSNVDSNFMLIVGYPQTKYLVWGWHAEPGSSSPLERMLPNGKKYMLHNENNSPTYTYPGVFNFKDERFVFGDTLEIGTSTVQVHNEGSIDLYGTAPLITSHTSSTFSQPITFAGAISDKMNFRMGTPFPAWGGWYFQSFTGTDDVASISLVAHMGVAVPSKAAIDMAGWKTDGGTGRTAMTGTEILLSVGAGATPRFIVRADGTHVTATGSESTGRVWTWQAGGYATWEAASGGGGTPGGSNTQLQYNNAGAFGGAGGVAYVSGGLNYTNVDDGFLANDAATGLHSNNNMYAQGGSAGFIFAGDNARAQIIHLSATNDEIYFRTNAGTLQATITSGGAFMQKAGAYHNWGTTSGASGYGFWDDGGVMKFKNSGGSWTAFGTGGGDMFLNATNTMGASGDIFFPVNGSETDFRIGAFELQGRATNYTMLAQNLYYNGTDIKHRATGAGSYIALINGDMTFNVAPSASAGATATVTTPFGINTAGIVVGGSGYYINFDGVAGTTGHGFWDDAGVMKSKDAGGSWIGLDNKILKNGTTTLTGDITIAGGSANSVFITGSGSEMFKLTQTGSGFYGLDIDALEYGANIIAGILPLNIQNDNTNTNAIRSMAAYYRNGANGANGIGMSFQYYIRSSTGSVPQAGETQIYLSNATNGAETAVMSFNLKYNGGGSLSEILRLNGDGSIALFNGTAPGASVNNGILLYSEDVAASAELKVRDEATNITTLSPHNFSGIPGGPSEEMAWSFYSERDGKYITVDMLLVIRDLEKVTGKKYVFTGKTKDLKK